MSRKLIQSNQTAFHIYEKYVISDRTKVTQEAHDQLLYAVAVFFTSATKILVFVF